MKNRNQFINFNYRLIKSQSLTRIENALTLLKEKIDIEHPELNSANQEIIGMMVMPENFFANSSKKGQTRQYSEEQAREIEVKLAALSARFPEILLITSIAWQKSGYYDEISQGFFYV